MFTRMLALPLFTHDMRGVIGLHDSLQKGDILVGDRAFCSFCHFALLDARGVLGCFRLHQRRPTDRSIAYNLVRLLMLRWAMNRGVDVGRVSFIDALRLLAMHALGLSGVEALIINPKRRGRTQPRVIRRTTKQYDLLTCPREQWKDRRNEWKSD